MKTYYWHEISNCLHILLHEVVGYAPARVLMIFICTVKIFPLLEQLTPKCIPYFITEWKHTIVNWFQSVYVADMDCCWYGLST